MKLIIASNNKGKIREIKEILGDKFDEILSQGEAGINVEVDETGTSFLENAILKARYTSLLVDCACLADDSGLSVDALGGAPGVYSARYSGGDDNDNIDLLLKNMDKITDRKAHFMSAVVLVMPDKSEYVGIGKCNGEILYKRSGDKGFGYDPIFYSYDLGKSFGEASHDEKNEVSHRKRALNDLLQKL